RTSSGDVPPRTQRCALSVKPGRHSGIPARSADKFFRQLIHGDWPRSVFSFFASSTYAPQAHRGTPNDFSSLNSSTGREVKRECKLRQNRPKTNHDYNDSTSAASALTSSSTAIAPQNLEPLVKRFGTTTHRSPAASADWSPRAESSTAIQRTVATDRRSRAVR